MFCKEDIESRSIPVPEAGCWLWYRATTSKGYGAITRDTVTHLAHRISYLVYKGDIRAEDCVLHKCDTRCCVNPEHLFLGDRKDNAVDRESKGRGGQVRGSRHYSTSLTEDDVRFIRKSKGVLKLTELGAMFGLTISAVNSIQFKRTWKHVED